MISKHPISVSQLNSYIKILFESDSNLQDIFICGEVSNFKNHYSSGHLYFSLKDDKSVVRAVMFSNNARKLLFNVSDGMKVVVRGKISCYEVSGNYQVYVQEIQPQGVGSVYLAFEQLKAKLSSEGIFDESLKKPLPTYPRKVGVITSRTGAVIHDIKNVIARRYPICEIVLYPVEVQGEKASSEIVQAFQYFNRLMNVDVIILGRGGGSLEELWSFNKEEVARAVYASKIPVISAVGHETDVTICDFVADRRASTPSVAAEMVTPDKNAIKLLITGYRERMKNEIQSRFNESNRRLDVLRKSVEKFSPIRLVDTKMEIIFNTKLRLKQSIENHLTSKISRYELLKKSLLLCSQISVLKRGYVILSSEGNCLKSVDDIKQNTFLDIKFHDGIVKVNINEVKKIG